MAKSGYFGTVKVNNDVLKEKADEAASKIQTCRQVLEDMNSELNNSVGYWRGEGYEAFCNSFERVRRDVENALCEYEKYPKDLLEYVGIYQEKIKSTEAWAEGINDLKLY